MSDNVLYNVIMFESLIESKLKAGSFANTAEIEIVP